MYNYSMLAEKALGEYAEKGWQDKGAKHLKCC